MDFGLNKLSVRDKTAEFVIEGLGEDVASVLTVRPAGQANRGYFNALLKAPKAKKIARSGGSFSAETLDEIAALDARLYAEHVVTDWRGIYAGGKPVKFSSEACLQFLTQLNAEVPHLFEELRRFCGNPANFVEEFVDVDETGNA